MGWFFKRKDADANAFEDAPSYRMQWERKPLPSPGAMNYAYESLALAPQSPISGAVEQRQFFRVCSGPQLYQFQTGTLNGIPLVAGQAIMQPLYDPSTGYVRGEPIGAEPRTQINIPVAFPTPIPTNDPFPQQMK